MLYLRRTIEMWSAGTPVEFLRDVSENKMVVRVLSGDRRRDPELRRNPMVEIFKDDVVERK